MNASGSAAILPRGGLTATTTGGTTGSSTSTSCDWLIKSRPSEVARTSNPRVPPCATATCWSVVTSTIVRSVGVGATVPPGVFGASSCETNSRFVQVSPLLAEGDRLDVGIEREHNLGTGHVVELDDLRRSRAR